MNDKEWNNYYTDSVARSGNFQKFFVSNFLIKVAQMFGDFLGFLKTSLFK